MYWTIQHASVLDSIESNGVFIPDFGKSELKCPMLCAFALRYFKLFNENSSDLPGVIFTFDNTFEKPLKCVDDVKEFLSSTLRHETILRHCVTDVFKSNNYLLLCLDGYPSTMRTLPMDIMFYELLEDYISPNGAIIGENWMKIRVQEAMLSWMSEEFPGWALNENVGKSNMMQRLLPYIKKSNIREEYKLNTIL